MINGVEVFESSIAIHVSNKNEVTYTSSTFDNTAETIDTSPAISEEDALNTAIRALEIEGNISQKGIKLYVYNKLEETKLVYWAILPPSNIEVKTHKNAVTHPTNNI